jgi:hypothetical protein
MHLREVAMWLQSPLLSHLQLEIKAYLESVYGLKVERVNTINYLGRKYLVPSHKVREGVWWDVGITRCNRE